MMINPNIWSLNKDRNIKALLLLLEQRVGSDHFRILEDSLHLQAIRITPLVEHPEVSVYIYCYAQSPGHFGVDLEYPLLIEREANDQTEHFNELDENKALEIIIMHLGLERE